AFIFSENVGTLLQEQSRLSSFTMMKILPEILNMTLHSHAMQELLKPDNKFDVIIQSYMFNEAFLALSHHFNARVIGFVPFSTLPHIVSLTGNSAPYSYVPLPFSGHTDDMSFLQRTVNMIAGQFVSLLYNCCAYPKQEKIMRERFPDFPPLAEIERERVDLIFSNNHFSNESPRPQTPNIIYIGGYHVQEPEPLTPEVQKILDNSPEGVVFLAFGTHVQVEKLPKEKIDAFLNTFSKIPYKVLLKYDGFLANKPENVETVAWIPQRGVLAHRNVKIFVSHGGKGSATESLYYGVPVLCVSFFGDQWKNCEDIAEYNYGIHLPFQDVTKETFENAFDELDSNPK
ncbi:Glycosyltransferase, partial [Oryctes borbonicus]